MANCPNCGSSHINIKSETNVNWGRAVAGWALFGVVGGAVAAVTGEDRNVNACLDCGTSWKAADLYKLLHVIKDTTGVTLDLSSEQDRFYMNSFVAELSPYLEALSKAEKQAEKLIQEAQKKGSEASSQGCSFGCFTSIAVFFTLGSAVFNAGFLVVLAVILVPPLIGLGVDSLFAKSNKNLVEQEMQKANKQANKIKLEAQENWRCRIEV